MTERKQPGIGLLIVVLVSVVFWLSLIVAIGSVRQYNATHNMNPSDTCRSLRAHGWEVEQSQCVAMFLYE